jgi:hypothetical protein
MARERAADTDGTGQRVRLVQPEQEPGLHVPCERQRRGPASDHSTISWNARTSSPT